MSQVIPVLLTILLALCFSNEGGPQEELLEDSSLSGSTDAISIYQNSPDIGSYFSSFNPFLPINYYQTQSPDDDQEQIVNINLTSTSDQAEIANAFESWQYDRYSEYNLPIEYINNLPVGSPLWYPLII